MILTKSLTAYSGLQFLKTITHTQRLASKKIQTNIFFRRPHFHKNTLNRNDSQYLPKTTMNQDKPVTQKHHNNIDRYIEDLHYSAAIPK